MASERKIGFSSEMLDLYEIDAHYAVCEQAVRTYYTTTNDVFVGYTNDQLISELNRRLEELDRSCAFLLLATIEACLRIDYLRRCDERRKDALSRRFRQIYNYREDKADLSEDILETWKQHGAPSSLISEIRGAWHYRNWLAHGRYWRPKFGRRYDYFGLSVLATQVERLLKNTP